MKKFLYGILILCALSAWIGTGMLLMEDIDGIIPLLIGLVGGAVAITYLSNYSSNDKN